MEATTTYAFFARLGAAMAFVAGLFGAFAFAVDEDRAATGYVDAHVLSLERASEYASSYLSAEPVAVAPTPSLKPSTHKARLAEPALAKVATVEIGGGVSVEDLVLIDAGRRTEAIEMVAERKCLAQALYYEARGEGLIGQLAVADVVMNRVASRIYPNSICGVVFEGSHRTTGCQFSFTCDGSMEASLKDDYYAEADRLASFVLAGFRPAMSRDATHYHADHVAPIWASSLVPTAYIGAHMFYRPPSRGGAALGAAPALLQ